MIEISEQYKVAIIGNGKVGQAYAQMFGTGNKDDLVVYDEPQIIDFWVNKQQNKNAKKEIKEGRRLVNECDMAIICVPTDLNKDKELDMSIVEEVVKWVETPIILIKSALYPGTTDRLIKKYKKKIAVSPEYVGEGNYFIPPWKYPDPQYPETNNFIVVGGEDEVSTLACEFLWRRMSPDIKIHLCTALEAEIIKLVENTYGALKVTWINTLYSLTKMSKANFIRVHQGWTADGRVDSMHQRTLSKRRGWKSKCWSKDIPALATYAKQVGAKDMEELINLVIRLNDQHNKLNEED